MSATETPEKLILMLRQVAAGAPLPDLPPGVLMANLDFGQTIIGHIHAMLTAFVLSEQAGDPVSETREYEVAKFPRWVPRWLQRRWMTRRSFTVTVTPQWTYPMATIKVPELGLPRGQVEILVTNNYGEDY